MVSTSLLLALSRAVSLTALSIFEPCEEPEAVENEYVMLAKVNGETVARIYTEAA